MADEERTTVRVIQNENIEDKGDSSSVHEKIRDRWVFGWDLEDIKLNLRRSKYREGITSYQGSYADCFFVRSKTMENYDKLVVLEKEYEKSFYSSSYYVPRPIEVQSHFKWGILTMSILVTPILLTILSTIGDAYSYGASLLTGLFALSVPVAFVIVIVRIIKRILLLKEHKESYAIEGRDYNTKYALYSEALGNYEQNKNRIYQEAEELIKDHSKHSLQAIIDIWERTVTNLNETPYKQG